MPRYLALFENVVGFSLFDCKGVNEIAVTDPSVQKSFIEFHLFSQMVKLIAFCPFPSTEVALTTMNAMTEGQVPEALSDFLADVLPGQLKRHKSGIVLGVSEAKLAGSIHQQFDIACQSDDIIREILRGIRLHFERFVETVTHEDLSFAQLGLSHGYSRAKVKFNQHGDDNMVISAVACLTGLEKDLNGFAMRLREWYSVHFPELSSMVDDAAVYAKLVEAIGERGSADPDLVGTIVGDPALADAIVRAAQSSIGREIEEVDLLRIRAMAARVVALTDYRAQLADYLHRRMHNIAPNLTALAGERMGAQLIMASGSLTDLAKSPASTIQLLGAEKALFNALKKRKATPKYGLIYNSEPVKAAETQAKGRVARSFANRLAIAGRIDAFADDFRSGRLGGLLKDAMDRRVESAQTRKVAEPNLEVMERIVAEARMFEQSLDRPQEDVAVSPRRRKKHRHHAQEEPEPVPEPQPAPEPVQEVEVTVEVPVEEETPRRRRHHRHHTVDEVE